MEIKKGVFRQPRQDLVDFNVSVSKYILRTDSLWRVSDFELEKPRKHLPKVDDFRNRERAIVWLYNHNLADPVEIRRKSSSGDAWNEIFVNAKKMESEETTEIKNAISIIQIVKKLKVLTKLSNEKHKLKSDFNVKVCNDDYINLTGLQTDEKFQEEYVYNDPLLSESMCSIIQSHNLEEIHVKSRKRYQDKDSQCGKPLSVLFENSTQVTHETVDSETQTDSRKHSEERIKREDIVRLLKETCSTMSECVEAKLDKGEVNKQIEKGTQMFEHITENDLYTLDWIHYNLFNININPHNLIVDEKIKNISEETAFSDEAVTTSIYI